MLQVPFQFFALAVDDLQLLAKLADRIDALAVGVAHAPFRGLEGRQPPLEHRHVGDGLRRFTAGRLPG